MDAKISLGHDIVDLIVGGHNAAAIRELAAQRRIPIAKARETIAAWREQRAAEIGGYGIRE
jgi:hypothetical protein